MKLRTINEEKCDDCAQLFSSIWTRVKALKGVRVMTPLNHEIDDGSEVVIMDKELRVAIREYFEDYPLDEVRIK